MELIKTTPELAKTILANGNRNIVIQNGQRVDYINLNNRTLFAEGTHFLEDVELFISVPSKAINVY